MHKKWNVIDVLSGRTVYSFSTAKEARKWAAIHNADSFEGNGSRTYEARRVWSGDANVAARKVAQTINEMFSAA